MCSISDGSTDPLLARFKVLEETVDKLHRENRSLKTKLQSYNTLSTFYHEARQQNKNLNKQLAEKEALIQQLKVSQKTLTAAAEHQAEPPRSLIECLMEELNRMRNDRSETERIYREKVEKLNQEIQKLQKQLEDRDNEIEKVSSWPQQEKDMELLRLQRSLAEKERVQATSEVLCRSLSDETHQLRRKLSATAEMCQQLVRCLEEARQKDNLNSEQHLSQNIHKENEHDATLRKLQEENQRLKQKVVHVEDLNAKWQKYDASREDYVKGLHLQLKELKGQCEHSKSSQTTHKHPDLLQKEISRLNRLLEEKLKEHTKLQQEAAEMVQARIVNQERIHMLEQQLIVYKDDFTSERADRERAQSRIQELVDEISALRRQGRRQDDKESAVKRNKTYTKRNVGDTQLGLNVEPAENRLQASPADRPDRQRSSTTEQRGQDELQCPRCLRIFQDRLGENFLEHISECCQ
ncbi:TNFAIP3-interacting protein 2-like [Hyla sarda]|uniref:TNFAIP3-interacting protein 2 n=1 Tax=Hyla sarda TaxID=327740 RepID=UPI0024C330DD|nr:TNFAIP3-interacting protein 2 [Hyla sarda]XP_056408713.1 TNFAIP3-interacting protein 2-like [Hyla sarda]